MRQPIFRWKAIGPLFFVLLLVALLVWLFAEPVARETTEEASTELLGTQVDVDRLDIFADETRVELAGLQVADPFDSTRNLVEAREILVRLNPEALAEKKLVIERFTLSGMRFGTQRETPARRVEGGGFAAQALRAVREWSEQFDVPLLQLTPIDTIRQLVLDPGQLSTIREAQSLAARADSTRRAFEANAGTLATDVTQTVDSARSLAERLAATDPKTLGVDGVRREVEAVRRTLAAIEEVERRVNALEESAGQGVQLLANGVETVDEARQKDYQFARSLLQLPTFNAPEIGNAFFGQVSIERFQQAMYWAQLAREYMPPGLLPREQSGPERLRASGATVRFPKEREYPSFLLTEGVVDFAIERTGGDARTRGEGALARVQEALRGDYEATVRGLTSAPELYGKPAQISARRRAGGTAIADLRADALINHVGERMRDSAAAALRGVQLPDIDLPGIPFSLAPGTGASDLTFVLDGDRVRARWAISSDQVAWRADTAGRKLNDIEAVVWRVLSGLRQLDVRAELAGPISSPTLSVSSNLDQAVADRLKAVVGEEIARAERRVRAKVDSLVDERVEPVKRQVTATRSQIEERIAREQARLDEAREALEAQLKRYGVPGEGILEKLPRIKF